MTTITKVTRQAGSAFQSERNHHFLNPPKERERSYKINDKELKTAAQGMTMIAYGDSHELPVRLLDFKAKCEDFQDLMQCIGIIDSYNEFDAGRIRKAAFWYLNVMHYLNEDNPNNGKQLFDFNIAREGSPAFYVTWNEGFGGKYIKDTEKAKDGTTLFWEEFTAADFKHHMEQLNDKIGADEFDIEETVGYRGNIYTARFWFD